MTLMLRYMMLDDVAEVAAIDKLAFSMPWPASSYAYEIGESPYSHMAVLAAVDGSIRPGRRSSRVWKGWMQRLMRGAGQDAAAQIISYGGMWKIMDEAHISTIATRPEYRGRGFGELLLAGLLTRASHLSAGYVVLEVRVGNLAARNLYHKYDFQIVYTKRNYYSDNGEDAYDMRLTLDRDMRTRIAGRYDTLRTQYAVVDQFTETPRPIDSR